MCTTTSIINNLFIPLSHTDVGLENRFPNNFNLMQNYPNPFNPSTTIKYQISNSSFTTIKVYDVLGNEITTLLNEEKTPGIYEVTWLAENYSSGIYFCRLRANNYTKTIKMMVLK